MGVYQRTLPAAAGAAPDESLGPRATGAQLSLPVVTETADERRHALLSLVVADLIGPSSELIRQVSRLASRVDLEEPALNSVRAIERQARRLKALAEGLVALRAVERGELVARRVSTEVGLLLARVIEAHQARARARSLCLECVVPPRCPTLSVDPGPLEELLARLLGIAIDTTPRGGRVRAALEPSEMNVRIEVEASLARPGRPSPRSRFERSPGTGVDLLLCQALAELQGASLHFTRRETGRSAVIILRHAGVVEGAEMRRGGPGEAKARLLVVDDDLEAREALALALGDDYVLTTASDGRQAVEMALSTRPDLVLMDLYMPRMGGLAALEAMRDNVVTAAVPVILISAGGDDLTRARSLDLGAVDFMQKPFSSLELKARIERSLRLTRRETQLQLLARTDALTGLANLRAFRSRLEDEVKRARRYQTPLSCVMVDMDHLKPINDELGHAAGDVALGKVAEVLRSELRETDFGARYGGDEFVMLLPHTSAAEARVLAERICARLRETTIEVRGRELHMSASFGIAALSEGEDETGETLVRQADLALYAAKRAGRGRVESTGLDFGPTELPGQVSS
ncbi:MAG TPA: diguanylate cyclase [Anaeromyxobacteraceae bacterium]|nr:diguanylate cyclase [Anaeromyxobacteraceae bacterium]